jgi:hypothetical protein
MMAILSGFRYWLERKYANYRLLLAIKKQADTRSDYWIGLTKSERFATKVGM